MQKDWFIIDRLMSYTYVHGNRRLSGISGRSIWLIRSQSIGEEEKIPP